MLKFSQALMPSVTCMVNSEHISGKFYFSALFVSNPWWKIDLVMNTCSTSVVFLQISSAGCRLGRFWALRIWSCGRGLRASLVLALYTAITFRRWDVLFLTSEGGDGVTWADSYSSVLLVSSQGTVGLEGGLLLCHSGSVRRRQSDEERRHHPFRWSRCCHDCIKPTYSLTGGTEQLSCRLKTARNM